MKRQIALFALVLFTAATVYGQGIEFFKGTWKEALAQAKKEGKLIFMDAYAEWCGPCKMMAARVFTDARVGEFYNRHFINVKMDMEKGEGLELRKKYPVSAYPTLLFIDDQGELVKKSVGAKPVEPFLKLGETVLAGIDNSAEYAKKYESGDRSPELIYNYVRALNRAGKSSLKIANDYLRDQDRLNTPDNLRIIYEAAIEVDSRIFRLLMDYREEVEALFSPEAVRDRILLAGENTLDKAIEFNSEMLLEECKEKVKEYYPQRADAFAAKADMAFAKRRKDEKSYEKALKDYVKKGIDQDRYTDISQVATEALQLFPKNGKVVDYAVELKGIAAERSGQSGYFLDYARTLAFSGDKAKALKAAEKGRKLAVTESKIAQMEAQKLVDQLQRDQ